MGSAAAVPPARRARDILMLMGLLFAMAIVVWALGYFPRPAAIGADAKAKPNKPTLASAPS